MADREELTSTEAARALGISPSLIRKLELAGITRPARRAGKYRIYSPSDLDELRQVITNRRAGTNQPLLEAS